MNVSTRNGTVLRSTDGGETWVEINTNTNIVTVLAIDPAMPSTIYAGTFEGVVKSVDRGESWRAINTNINDWPVTTIAIDQSVPNTVYLGTFFGSLFKSVNNGRIGPRSVKIFP